MADQPDSVDIFAGNAIRARRRMAGVSQERLAQAIGVTFQQVQKYEKGANRVSLSMLSRIARHLNAPPATFFPPVDEDDVVAGLGPCDALAASLGGRELAEAFLAMPPHARAGVLQVAQSIVEAIGEEPGPSYVSGGDQEARRHVA